MVNFQSDNWLSFQKLYVEFGDLDIDLQEFNQVLDDGIQILTKDNNILELASQNTIFDLATSFADMVKEERNNERKINNLNGSFNIT